MGVSTEIVKQLANKYNVNTHVVPINILKRAVDIEFEHKDIFDMCQSTPHRGDIIGNDPDKAFHIVMAHLREYPDYYIRLIKMEAEADKYWTGKVKPDIYNTHAGTKTTQIRSTRASAQTIEQGRRSKDTFGARKPSDLYGVRKGVKHRRTAHFYPDYIPKQANKN